MSKQNKKNRRGGFALLFSVLVSSLLLTIGLSVFGIALKELAISTASRQSIHAFYAADSGLECAKYWDLRKGSVPSLVDGQDGGVISCGLSQSLTLTSDKIPGQETGRITSRIPGSENDNVKIGASSESNFNVEIEKSRMTTNNVILTEIWSRGYDSFDTDRLERGIYLSY